MTCFLVEGHIQRAAQLRGSAFRRPAISFCAIPPRVFPSSTFSLERMSTCSEGLTLHLLRARGFDGSLRLVIIMALRR